MTHRQTNILKVYHQATADELSGGLEWYAAAHDEAERLACRGTTIWLGIRETAAVIAAVSPGLRWERNVVAAERILSGGTTLYGEDELTGLGVRWYDGVAKARAIIDGRNPAYVLKGNKVRAFWHCIWQPDNGLHVCIDGHAYSIWTGERIVLADVPTLDDRLYNRISGDYAAVAKHVGIRPCQLQAITWVTHRRIHEV